LEDTERSNTIVVFARLMFIIVTILLVNMKQHTRIL